MFESPEVVLRCIRCLHGIELPDMSNEGRRNNTTKSLVVKADQKTAEFLKEFEDTLGRSEVSSTASVELTSRLMRGQTRPRATRSDTSSRASLTPIARSPTLVGAAAGIRPLTFTSPHTCAT